MVNHRTIQSMWLTLKNCSGSRESGGLQQEVLYSPQHKEENKTILVRLQASLLSLHGSTGQMSSTVCWAKHPAGCMRQIKEVSTKETAFQPSAFTYKAG